MKILVQADRVLNAVLVDLLFEIAVAIEQTDRDKIQIEVARRFAMVTRENAEAAGIIRDRFVETEFGGEISDRFFNRAGGAGFPVGIFARKIIAVGVMHFLQLAQKILVLRDFNQA